MWPWSPPRHSEGLAAALRGTPVVPGLAYGPVVLVAQEVSPEAIAAYAGHPDAESALAAYDAAAEAVAEGFSAKAARASGAATEVLTASAGLTRDKGLRQAVAGRVEGGTALLEAVHEGVAQFVDIFTAMGGLMAERATDLLDIERRLVARLVGEPEPGVVLPDVPSVLVASDLAPADTAGLDPALVLALVTEKGGATSHTAIIARQLGIPCVVGVAGALGLPAGARGAGRRDRRHHRRRPSTPTMPRARVEADRAARAAVESWTGPAETTDGVRVKLLANVADGESARHAAAGAGRGRRAVPHRAVLPRPPRRAVGRRAGEDLRRGARRVPAARTGTSSSAPSTPARTSRSRSRRWRTRRTPPSASAACGWLRTTRGCSSGSSTASPPLRRRRAPRRG